MVEALHAIQDHHVGVEQRVARTRGPVLEGRADEAVAGNLHCAAGAAPGAARLPLEVAERLGQRGFVAGGKRVGEGGVAEAVENADALGRLEGHVEAGHRARSERTADLLLGAPGRARPTGSWSPPASPLR
jgi:hypothetical protein